MNERWMDEKIATQIGEWINELINKLMDGDVDLLWIDWRTDSYIYISMKVLFIAHALIRVSTCHHVCLKRKHD